MELISSREKVLKKVRMALTGPKELVPAISNHESQIFNLPNLSELSQAFKASFEKQGGICFLCANKYDFIDKLLEFTELHSLEKLVVFSPKIQSYLDSCSFSYLSNSLEVVNAQAAIVDCEYLAANSGNVFQTDVQSGGRTILNLPPIQCVMAYKDQIVPGEQLAYEKLKARYEGKMPSNIAVSSAYNFSLGYDYKPYQKTYGIHQRVVFIIQER